MTTHDRKKAFFAKSILQRSAIVFAGPAVNFLFAIAIFAILFSTLGRPVTPPILAAIEIGGAAHEAGLQPQDRVLAVDGRKVSQFEDIRTTVTLALDTPLSFTVQRGGETKNIIVTPRRKEEQDRFGFKHERGYIGVLSPSNGLALSSLKAVEGEATGDDITRTAELLNANLGKVFTVSMADSTPGAGGLAQLLVHPSATQNKDLASSDLETLKKTGLILATHPSENRVVYLPVAAVAQGVLQTADAIDGTLKAIGQIIMGTRSATELGGVIRIGAVAGDMAEQGFIAILTFMALLSINLGLINLFPIPMLDGGHLVFYAIEAVRGKPLPDHVLDYAFRFGLVILVALMVFSNLNDILQLVFS